MTIAATDIHHLAYARISGECITLHEGYIPIMYPTYDVYHLYIRLASISEYVQQFLFWHIMFSRVKCRK